ncbi:histone-lysine N-methyltransferase SETD2 isoform X2 [Crotalus tigris]|uniref:histone-lysine N-methyltransferase SETD2 isoform X2 n=1 Tax=Crotalus tigris TaxID=88082 RepID=UPI00192FB25A|nr:histone-lysine N-methyltransferase SETD2 isoform X2 [Crotalus tigris]
MSIKSRLRHESRLGDFGPITRRWEEENEGKSENVQKPGFVKGPAVFKGVASSRFLPKGTRTKVNLEEQGRQKVSFSFSLTKKTLPNRFLAALGNEKPSEGPSTSLPPLPSDFTSKAKAELSDPLGVSEEFSPPKPKAELGKIHFKKHLLNVTTKPFPVSAVPPVPVAPPPPAAVELGEMPSSPPPPPPPPPIPLQIKPAPTPVLIPISAPQVAAPAPITPLLIPLVETAIRTTKEPPPNPAQETLELQNAVVGGSEAPLAPGVSEDVEPALVKRHPCVAKEEEMAEVSKGAPGSKKPRRKFSLSEGVLPGSESDEDSVRTSSSQRSHEIKAAASSEKEKDSRKSSAASKTEEPSKVSLRSRSERDEKYSSYSRPERDSRYSSRSRSDRERRRSRSRSRPRSERGSRTTSSYSRSERSHYYDSDRRYHRSSPYREKTRYSRSYLDSRVRESSDSEEEYRRMHSRSSTDSRHASSHSSSYRDSRTSSSYSKSERESSKSDSAYPDVERRGKQARLERETRRISESEISKRCSPVSELRHRRDASHSKAEGSGNTSRSKPTSSKSSAPKSDKFKSSFCCTESEDIKDQSNCVDSEASSVPDCETKTAHLQKPETASPVSQFSDCLTFGKLEESKTGSPLSKMNELAGMDSHISIDPGSLGNIRGDHLRTSSPVELDTNGSPERRTPKRLSSSFEVEEIDLSSDDNLDRPELPRQAKSPRLSSDGLQNLSLPKRHNPDESLIFSGESKLQLLEEKIEVSNLASSEYVSSFTKQVSHSKILSKEGSDPRDPSCKTKDPTPCYLPEDASVSLCYSEIEIEVEPSDTEATQEPPAGVHAEIPIQSFTSTDIEDQNPSGLAQENEKYTGFSSVEPTPVRGFRAEEYFVEVDNQHVAQQQPASENMLHLETPIQQKAKEVLMCPEVALELDILPAESIVQKVKSPLKNEHCYYLEMPVKEPEKEELEEKDAVVFDEGTASDMDEPAPGVLVMKDKEDSLIESAFSDILSPSCHIVVTVEETETIEEEPRYGSGSNTPEISSVHNEDYSDTAESASEHPSDESESEGSDSDDSSVPRNRLQSVVVIPKNSTLTLEESSSCSSRNSQSNRRYLDHWEDSRPESTKPFSEDMPDSLEMNNNLPNEIRALPSRETERSLATSTELKRTEGPAGLQPQASQAQSDDVDSTSHSEPAPDAFHKPDERIVYSETTAVTRSVGVSQGEDLHYLSSFEMTNTMSRSQAGVSKSDRRQGRSAFAGLSHPADFSREDGFHSTEDLGSLGWDFSQPEKPSSTYQQPDSSYGVFPGYVYPPPPGPYMGSHGYWPDSGYWDPRLTNRPSAISYERMQGQVPDSLTEDHEEYEEVDRWVDESQLYFPDQSVKFQSRDPREKGSVQAHEISSNSAKDFPTTSRERKEQEAKAMERSDMKERGPLKKRLTDLGSDSESDGGSQERKKIKTESEPLPILPQGSPTDHPLCFMEDFRDPQRWKECAREGKMPCYFDLIEENVYLTERKKNKSHRDIKRMLCECPTVSKEEIAQGEVACGEDCLNRLLMIECSSRCPNGEHCSNRRFQRKQHADVEVILTEKKGWGLRAAKDLPSNTFVLEYCGEVLDHKEFKTRVKEYARNKNIHYYFMALKNDEIIDATQKGNCSRFMNHSCEPNCETQKWTVNGQLRVGFFTTKLVTSGSELTFDYQFQRYGKEAQKCFCGSANCRGYLGGENRVSIRAAGGKMKKERSRKKDSVDGELEALLENGEGLSDKNQVLSLSRLMVRTETPEQKLTCLKLIQMSSKAKEPTSDEGSSGEQRKVNAHDAGKKMDEIKEEVLACSTIPVILKNKIRKESKKTPGMKTTIASQQKALTPTITPPTEMPSKPEDLTTDESINKDSGIGLSLKMNSVDAHDAEVDVIAAEEDLTCSTISANLENKEGAREAVNGSPRTGQQKDLPHTSRPHTKVSSERKTFNSAEGGRRKRRRSISLDLKMKIIKAYRARKKAKIIAQEEGLAYSTIFTILKDKKRIREALKVLPGTRKIITQPRKRLVRPCITHTKASPKPKTPSSAEGRSKKQRTSISLDVKMRIIRAYEAGTKVQVISREEGLARTTIFTILRDQKRIKEAMKELPGTRTIITKPRKGHVRPLAPLTNVSYNPNPTQLPPITRCPPPQIPTKVSAKPTAHSSAAGIIKKQRTSINLDRKMKIIEAYEGGEKASTIAKEEGLGHTTIFTILKDAKRIKEASKELPGTRKTITRRQKALVPPVPPPADVSTNPETPASAEGNVKKQRTSIDLNMKMKIIAAHEAGKKATLIAREEGLAHTTVWTILRDRKKIRALAKGSAGTDTTITRHRTGLIHQTEQLLVLWIEDQIRKRNLISFPRIQEKALSIFAILKERASEAWAQTFDASRGWFLRFQRRFNYQNIPTKGETTGLDQDAARRFLDELDDLLAEGGYLPEQIFSVDKTRLSWKQWPEGTYLHRGAQAVPGYKIFHDRITVLLGGNVAGFKLKPFLIHKSEGPFAFQNLVQDTLPVYYRSGQKIWMTRALFEDWLMTCFTPQVKDYCLQKTIPFKILLIVSHAPGHPLHLNNLQPDVKVVHLPRNTGPLLHPMDQGAVTAFKEFYLQAVLTEAIAMMEKSRVSLNEFWRRYDILRCMGNIATAWQGVSVTCMQGLWGKCLKRFADLVRNFEGFDPDEYLDQTNQNILTLSQALNLQIDAEAVKKWVASMEGELSNDDLIELREELSTQQVMEEGEEEEQIEIKPKNFTMKRLARVFSDVEKILSELEKMDPDTERFEWVRERILEILQCYREIYEEKKRKQNANEN